MLAGPGSRYSHALAVVIIIVAFSGFALVTASRLCFIGCLNLIFLLFYLLLSFCYATSITIFIYLKVNTVQHLVIFLNIGACGFMFRVSWLFGGYPFLLCCLLIHHIAATSITLRFAPRSRFSIAPRSIGGDDNGCYIIGAAVDNLQRWCNNYCLRFSHFRVEAPPAALEVGSSTTLHACVRMTGVTC